MSTTTRQIATLLAVLGILGMPLSPLATGTAAAASTNNTTTEQSYSTKIMTTAERKCAEPGLMMLVVPACAMHYGAYEVVNGSLSYTGADTSQTAEQLHWDLFLSTVTMDDARDQITREAESQSNRTVNLALAEAKIAIVQCMNNGSSELECQQQAISEVNDVYSSIQMSLYVQENRQAQRYRSMNVTFDEHSNLSRGDMVPNLGRAGSDYDGFVFNDRTVRLYNGSKVNVTQAAIYYDTNDNWNYYDMHGVHLTHYDGQYFNIYEATGKVGEGWESECGNMNAKAPDGQTIIAANCGDYNSSLTQLNESRNQAIDQAQVLTSDIFAHYDAGEVSVGDVLGPMEMAQTMSTSYDDSGHYSYVASTAAYLNYSTNATMAFNITWTQDCPNCTTHTANGQLYATEGVFQNGIQAGQTYNASGQNGSVYWVYQQGSQTKTVTLNNTYTINSITNTETGEKINSTSLQSTDFETTNTADLNGQVRRIIEERLTLQQAGGGGLSLPDGFLNNLLTGVGSGVVLAVVVVAGVLVIYIRILTP